jgi:hypothetical protein
MRRGRTRRRPAPGGFSRSIRWQCLMCRSGVQHRLVSFARVEVECGDEGMIEAGVPPLAYVGQNASETGALSRMFPAPSRCEGPVRAPLVPYQNLMSVADFPTVGGVIYVGRGVSPVHIGMHINCVQRLPQLIVVSLLVL